MKNSACTSIILLTFFIWGNSFSFQDPHDQVGDQQGRVRSNLNFQQLTRQEFYQALRNQGVNRTSEGSEPQAIQNVSDSLPDLVAYGLVLSLNPRGLPINDVTVGDDIYLNLYLANIGTASANGFPVDMKVDGSTICSIRGMLTKPNTYWLYWCTVPWRATAGLHLFAGSIDESNLVRESDESNNTTEIVRTSFSLPPDGLRLWLRADAGIRKTNSNKVSGWTDLSGNGNDAIQKYGDLKPLFVDSAVSGKPAIRFDHTYLQTGERAVRGASAFTMFCVLNYRSLPKNISTPIWNGASENGGDGYGLGRLEKDGRIFSGWTAGGDAGGDSVQLGAFRINSSTYGQSRHTVYVNGSFVARTKFNTSNFTSDVFTIGRTGGTPRMLYPYGGDIAEVVVYERLLPDQERKVVEQYLERKYDISPGNDASPPRFSAGFTRHIDFGDVYLSASKATTLNVFNGGGADLIIDSILSDNASFTVNVSQDTIKSFQSKSYIITYAPVSAGPDTGNIVFLHNAESSPDTFKATGTGDPRWLHLSTDHVEFADAFVGSQQSFTIDLESTVPRREIFTSSVSDSIEFSFSPGRDTLESFERFHYRKLVFHPKTAGNFSGQIIFTSTDSLPAETLRVQGTGIMPFPEQETATSWQWLNPFPQGNNLFGTTMLDSNTIIAVGGAGTFLKTVDGGAHWKVRNYMNGTATEYSDVHALSEHVAIALGSGKILRTTDAGDSWTTVAVASPAPPAIPNRLSFGNDLVGTAYLAPVLMRTYDGGVTWSGLPPDNITGSGLIRNLATIGDDTVVAVGGDNYVGFGFIVRSTDGGATWHDTLETEPLNAVAFLDRSLGIAAGEGSSVYRTRDGGSSWEKLPIPSSINYFFNAVDAEVLDSLVYVVTMGFGGRIIRTSDGGQTWSTVVLDSNAYLTSTYFMDKQTGIAVGYAGKIFRTSDGGQTWKSLVNGSTAGLTAASFVNQRIGFAIGYAPIFPGGTSVLRTTNSGLNWIETRLPGFNNPRGVDFQSEKNGLVVDALGWINRTTNGGATWTASHVPDVEELYAVSFIDTVNGVLSGEASGQARLLQTTDGGETWINRLVGMPGFLFDVSFVDSSTIVAVGEGNFTEPLVVRSSDKGATWNTIDVSGIEYLRKVSFADAHNGMAVGFGYASTPILLRTTTGGLTWTGQTIEEIGQIEGISMFDRNRAFALGFGGRFIYKTEDGGITWKADPTPTTNYLYALHGVHTPIGGGIIFAVGSGGTILCSAITPLSPKTWTGAVDSSWNNDGNWTPNGAPVGYDSVIIGPSFNRPVIFQEQQQVVIAALTILSDGHLTITNSLAQFVVAGGCSISGTLEMDVNAQTNIIVGGNWSVTPGGSGLAKTALSSNRGFIAGRSTLFYTGHGRLQYDPNSPVYNVVFDSSSSMNSQSNLRVNNQCVLKGNVSLRSVDTVFIANTDPNSVLGNGKIVRGTIERKIGSATSDSYRFESESTYVKFSLSGTIPSSVTMTSFPDTNPSNFGTQWVEVPSHAVDSTNTIAADSLTHFTTWALGVPRPTAAPAKADAGATFQAAVRRVYDIKAEGGSNFRLRLALHYEQSEVPAGIDENSLRLFYLSGTGSLSKGNKGGVLPIEYALEQNYPNPFNPLTVIRYQLPVQSYVTLKIYNILGQVVATLVDGMRDAGYESATLDGSSLSSGLYFYRLQAMSISGPAKVFTQVRKMILVK